MSCARWWSLVLLFWETATRTFQAFSGLRPKEAIRTPRARSMTGRVCMARLSWTTSARRSRSASSGNASSSVGRCSMSGRASWPGRATALAASPVDAYTGAHAGANSDDVSVRASSRSTTGSAAWMTTVLVSFSARRRRRSRTLRPEQSQNPTPQIEIHAGDRPGEGSAQNLLQRLFAVEVDLTGDHDGCARAGLMRLHLQGRRRTSPRRDDRCRAVGPVPALELRGKCCVSHGSRS